MDYVLHVIILCSIFVILSTSFNLLIGYAGIFSIAHAAFYGIGAYTASLLALHLKWSFPATICMSIIAGAVTSVLLAIPSLRTKGLYIAVTSFGFQLIAYSVFLNWHGVTHGPAGLTGIPKPSMLGVSASSNISFLVLSAAVAIFTVVLIRRLTTMPFGRALRAIKEDEIAAEALGKNIVSFKIVSFMVASSLAAMAGALYAHYMAYINPYSFTLEDSLAVLTMVIVGGSGTLRGPVVGAVLLVSLPEILRFVMIPSSIAAPVRQVMYGALLVLFLRWKPNGLLGR